MLILAIQAAPLCAGESESAGKGETWVDSQHHQFSNSADRLASEELFWIGGDGGGTLTRGDLDHSLDDKTLLRWANKVE